MHPLASWLAQAQDGIPGSLVDDLSAAGVLGFAIVCVRVAITQGDKRAAAAETREQTCTTALAATVAATAALTAEVRDGDDALTQQLSPIRQGIDELLGHARRGQEGR